VLRKISESSYFADLSRTFVTMQLGYLRRDPDTAASTSG
jgi:hypothetical protein